LGFWKLDCIHDARTRHPSRLCLPTVSAFWQKATTHKHPHSHTCEHTPIHPLPWLPLTCKGFCLGAGLTPARGASLAPPDGRKVRRPAQGSPKIAGLCNMSTLWIYLRLFWQIDFNLFVTISYSKRCRDGPATSDACAFDLTYLERGGGVWC